MASFWPSSSGSSPSKSPGCRTPFIPTHIFPKPTKTKTSSSNSNKNTTDDGSLGLQRRPRRWLTVQRRGCHQRSETFFTWLRLASGKVQWKKRSFSRDLCYRACCFTVNIIILLENLAESWYKNKILMTFTINKFIGEKTIKFLTSISRKMFELHFFL